MIRSINRGFLVLENNNPDVEICGPVWLRTWAYVGPDVCWFYFVFCCYTVTVFTEQDGFLVQINTSTGGDRALDLSLLFHLHPQYPSCPPDISVSSTAFSRTQCHSIRQKLLDQAATLSPEPMVHQLVEWIQVNCNTHLI